MLTYLSTLSLLHVTNHKGDGILLGEKVPGGPTPMYGHGLNLNEQWVFMLEKVRACSPGFRAQSMRYCDLPANNTTFWRNLICDRDGKVRQGQFRWVYQYWY